MGGILESVELDYPFFFVIFTRHSGSFIMTILTLLNFHSLNIWALFSVFFRVMASTAFIYFLVKSMGKLGRFRNGGFVFSRQEFHFRRPFIDIRSKTCGAIGPEYSCQHHPENKYPVDHTFASLIKELFWWASFAAELNMKRFPLRLEHSVDRLLSYFYAMIKLCGI